MEKLKLRQANEADAEFIFSMVNDKKFEKHYLERLIPKSIEDAKKEIRHREAQSKIGTVYYFIIQKGKEKIGILDIYKISQKDKKGSIGYGIIPDLWSKSYGSQACKMGLEFMKKKLKLHAAEAASEPENLASKRVLEKNGFKSLGIAKDYYFDRGKFIDRELYWKILE